MPHVRWLGLGIALALGLGVIAYAIDRGSADGTSGIRGIVLAGPACPGPVPAPLPPGALPPSGIPFRTACPDRPVAIALTVADERGRTVASVTSGTDGRFAVALPPGTYVLSSAKGLPALRPQKVTVPAGTWVDVELHADTGIR